MSHSEIVSLIRVVPDLVRDTSRCDPLNGRVGLVGYEINFKRYDRSPPPRPPEKTKADLRVLGQKTVRTLPEVTGSPQRT